MLNISEPKITKQSEGKYKLFEQPVFDLLFRSYFLLAMLASVIALSLWLAHLMGSSVITSGGLSGVVWHTHEMLFGFAATVAVGFLLTAAQTWTGLPSIKGKGVFYLVMLWCIARALLWANTELSIIVAILVQAVWWFSIIWVFSRLVIGSNNRRNYFFIPLLTVMASLNITILIADVSGNSGVALHFSKSMVLLFTLLMTVLGGRVIPFFTVNGAKTQAIINKPLIESLLILTVILSIMIFILEYFIALPFTPAALMIIAGLLHFVRLSRWRTSKTLPVALLWSLHTSYIFMALGMILLGLSYLDIGITFSSALHLITIGAVGLMILAMMSRVSLGHTGRMLEPRRIISYAFGFMILSAIIRTFLPLFHLPVLAWQLSSFLWAVAGIIFIFVYWPILTAHKVTP